MTCDPTPQTQKSSTTWGPLAAPRTNHGLNPMFDKQTSLMDASCRRGDKQARRPSYNLHEATRPADLCLIPSQLGSTCHVTDGAAAGEGRSGCVHGWR